MPRRSVRAARRRPRCRQTRTTAGRARAAVTTDRRFRAGERAPSSATVAGTRWWCSFTASATTSTTSLCGTSSLPSWRAADSWWRCPSFRARRRSVAHRTRHRAGRPGSDLDTGLVGARGAADAAVDDCRRRPFLGRPAGRFRRGPAYRRRAASPPTRHSAAVGLSGRPRRPARCPRCDPDKRRGGHEATEFRHVASPCVASDGG